MKTLHHEIAVVVASVAAVIAAQGCARDVITMDAETYVEQTSTELPEWSKGATLYYNPLPGCGGVILNEDIQSLATALEGGSSQSDLDVVEGAGEPADLLTEIVAGGRGQAMESWGRTITPLTLGNFTYVRRGARTYVFMQATRPDGATRWMAHGDGSMSGCLLPTTPELESLYQQEKEARYFNPLTAACTRIVAAGGKVGKLKPREQITFEGVRLMPANPALEHASSGIPTTSKLTTWRVAGDLSVRRDTFEGCFTKDPPSDSSDLFSRLRVDRRLCVDHGDEHWECRTPLAVWEGSGEPGRYLAFRLRYKNVGPTHFVDGAPVDPSEFAETIVGLQVDEANKHTLADIVHAMDAAAQDIVAKPTADVRFTRSVGDKTDFNVRFAVASADLGKVRETSRSDTSRYVKGQREVHNPKYPDAQERVREAERSLQRADDNLVTAKEQAEREREACRNAAKEAKAKMESAGGVLGTVGSIAGTGASAACELVSPDMTEFQQAQAQLRDANYELSQTPEIVMEDIEGTWTYSKKVFTRDVKVVVKAEVLNSAGKVLKTKNHTIRDSISDYQVADDSEHNIDGHEPDMQALQEPEHVLKKLAPTLRSSLEGFLHEETKSFALASAYAVAGTIEGANKKVSPAAAIAAQVAGYRVKSKLKSGRGPTAQPPVKLGKDECLLVTAHTTDAGGVEIGTASGDMVDDRHKSPGWIEQCGEGEAFGIVGEDVEWGVFVTSVDPKWIASNKLAKQWLATEALVSNARARALEVKSGTFARAAMSAGERAERKGRAARKAGEHEKARELMTEAAVSFNEAQQISAPMYEARQLEEVRQAAVDRLLETVKASGFQTTVDRAQRIVVLVPEAFLNGEAALDFEVNKILARLGAALASQATGFRVDINIARPTTKAELEAADEKFQLIRGKLSSPALPIESFEVGASLRRHRNGLELTFTYEPPTSDKGANP